MLCKACLIEWVAEGVDLELAAGAMAFSRWSRLVAAARASVAVALMLGQRRKLRFQRTDSDEDVVS